MVSGWKSKGDQIFHFMGGMRPFMYMGEVGGEGGHRQKLSVVRAVYSGLWMVGEPSKVSQPNKTTLNQVLKFCVGSLRLKWLL